MKAIRMIPIATYALLGTATLAAGAAVLLAPFGVFPLPAPNQTDAERHLSQELGSALIFVGLICAWCLFHPDRSRGVHHALFVFFALLSLVHWLDYFRGTRPLLSGVGNTVPAGLLFLVTLLDRQSKKAR